MLALSHFEETIVPEDDLLRPKHGLTIKKNYCYALINKIYFFFVFIKQQDAEHQSKLFSL
jgi:hypothetical protein